MEKVVLGVCVVEHEGAEATDAPQDVGIIFEGCTVPQDPRDVANLWPDLQFELELSQGPAVVSSEPFDVIGWKQALH